MPTSPIRVYLVFLLLVSSLWSPLLLAASNPEPAKTFATVWRLRGDVTAYVGDATAGRPLREGGSIYVGDRLRADSTGEAVLKTRDGGMIAVRPGAEFVAEEFVAEGKSSDRQVLRLLTGSLRLISGWIGKLNPNGHKVLTPQATIGIRGTDHEPYVLSAELAAATQHGEGTYDKVNRGGTTLDVNGNNLDVDAGRVGFARSGNRSRALMTILLPVLLDKVPAFYVPGHFDGELDRYAKKVNAGSLPVAPKAQLLATPAESTTPITGCNPKQIAENWLDNFDRAIARRDLRTILNLFAGEAAARVSVRNTDGSMTTVELNRDDLVQSTLAALQGLSDYQQRRMPVDARLVEAEPAAACQQIDLKSFVIEQGRQSGKPYRFEALEEYRLELRDGRWQAITAESTQR